MKGSVGKEEANGFAKVSIVSFAYAGVEPHAVVIKLLDAFVAVAAVHGGGVDLCLVDPAIFWHCSVGV